jgi:hypothetical protein
MYVLQFCIRTLFFGFNWFSAGATPFSRHAQGAYYSSLRLAKVRLLLLMVPVRTTDCQHKISSSYLIVKRIEAELQQSTGKHFVLYLPTTLRIDALSCLLAALSLLSVAGFREFLSIYLLRTYVTQLEKI